MRSIEHSRSDGQGQTLDMEDADSDRTTAELEMEAARDAIKAIPAFPRRETMLQDAFGLGPGAFLNQLVFWSGKGIGICGDKEWVYKTLKQWKEERALSRNQVDKAREKLKEEGVLEERPYIGNKIHYKVNWVRLAAILNVELSLHHVDKPGLPPEEQTEPSPVEQSSLHGGERSLTERTPDITGQKPPAEGGSGGEIDNAASYDIRAYEHLLPSAEASGRSPLIRKRSDSLLPEYLAPPPKPAPAQPSKVEINRVFELLWMGDNLPRRLAVAHLLGERASDGAPITVEDVARAVCRELNEGSEEATDRYVALVKGALAELRHDLRPPETAR